VSFETSNEIWFTIYQMVMADVPRAQNRARINDLFVGEPPFTDEECVDNKIFCNVNWLEPRRAMATAQLQARQAYLKTPRYFDVSLDTGPRAKRTEWGEILTREINISLKNSHPFTNVRKSQISSSLMHGPGHAVWTKKENWCPVARGIEDILVPSLTLRDYSNLDYFAVFTTFTLAELTNMTTGPLVDRGWNMPLIAALKKRMEGQLGTNSQAYFQNWQYPEKVAQDIVENSGYIGVDAAPRVRCYDFYFKKEIEGKEQWCRRILLDRVNEPYADIGQTTDGASSSDFLFNPGDRVYAEDRTELLHTQFADNNPVVPFRYHNQRSLGFLLYAVGHFQNRIRCKSMDAFFESLSMYFRINSTGDKERLQNIDLFNYCVIPEGVGIVPQQERNQVNWQNVGQVLAGNRQLIQEMSAVWSDASQNQGNSPTATQIVADATNRNALVSDAIADGMDDAEVLYQQLCKRFATSDHPDCVRVRQKCLKAGVDKAIFKDTESWVVRAQRTIGGGNKAIELTMVNQLAAMAPGLGPQQQQLIKRMQVVAYSDNPELAEVLVPDAAQAPSATTQTATLAWGTLMDMQPVALTTAIDHKEYASTLLTMLFSKVQQVSMAGQQGQLPDMHTLMGLNYVSQTILAEVQKIAADKSSADWVKHAETYLSQINNELKAWAQRVMEAQKAAQPQQDPKVAIEAAKAKQAMQIQQVETQQRLQQREQSHALTIQHRQTEHSLDTAAKLAEIHQDNREHKVDTALDVAERLQGIEHNDREHQVGLSLDAAESAARVKRGSPQQAAAEFPTT
jgi:hypothetical protein